MFKNILSKFNSSNLIIKKQFNNKKKQINESNNINTSTDATVDELLFKNLQSKYKINKINDYFYCDEDDDEEDDDDDDDENNDDENDDIENVYNAQNELNLDHNKNLNIYKSKSFISNSNKNISINETMSDKTDNKSYHNLADSEKS